MSMSKDNFFGGAALATAFALGLATTSLPANAMTKAENAQLSYLQVKGTGLANRCADVTGEDRIQPTSGQTIVEMCMEPTSFAIEHEFGNEQKGITREFVPARIITRQTYSLDAIEGPITIENGNLVFHEKEGIDYAPVTLKDKTRGEGYPLMFNIKGLVAEGSGDTIKPGFSMKGKFKTPSYRTGLFQDPKGRGGTTGYDVQPGLLALQTGMEGDERIYKENNKVFDESEGQVEFLVDQVDDKEVGGVFVSLQKGDSDMGAHEALDILIKGKWYARVE